MVCYRPMNAYRSASRNDTTGKYGLTFSGTRGYGDIPMVPLPCGNCIGCRSDRAEGWAVRCRHEAQQCQYANGGQGGSSFLTLTFRDDALPADGSGRKETMVNFIRMLKYYVAADRKKRGGAFLEHRSLGYLLCSEYGDMNNRVHYHLIIFGYDFPDKVVFKTTPGGHVLFRSELLEKAWPHGFSTVGTATYESARYVASYVVKKVTGERAKDEYHRAHPLTGEFVDLEPEFATMSLDPAIGKGWFERYHADVFPDDFVIVDGVRKKPPRYYEKLYAKMFGEEALEPIKRQRRATHAGKKEDRTRARLAVREEIHWERFYRSRRGGV